MCHGNAHEFLIRDLVQSRIKVKMPRRSELLEEERNYRLVVRSKEEKGKLIKETLAFLFSSVGIVLLGVFTAFLGAKAYIALELPSENQRYEAKKEIAKKVDSAAYYLGRVCTPNLSNL